MAYIDVSLEDEDGENISSLSDGIYLPADVNLTGFRLLKYLDHYGDTVFNHLQMNDLIQDLEIFKGSYSDTHLIDELISLAKQCKTGVHSYLVFYGD
jgi:hypothetical protein